MLILPQSCFLHVPKTGGTWVRQAIEAAGVPCQAFSIGPDHHPGLAQCPCPEKFKFAFVRHPLSLYRSYWQYKMTYGWDLNNPLDTSARADDFTSFIENVLQMAPGIYSRSLHDYVGPPGKEIDFIGKYENLADDLIKALQLAGERFEEQPIRNLAAANQSDKHRFPATFTPALAERVLRAESEALNRFGYAARE